METAFLGFWFFWRWFFSTPDLWSLDLYSQAKEQYDWRWVHLGIQKTSRRKHWFLCCRQGLGGTKLIVSRISGGEVKVEERERRGKHLTPMSHHGSKCDWETFHSYYRQTDKYSLKKKIVMYTEQYKLFENFCLACGNIYIVTQLFTLFVINSHNTHLIFHNQNHPRIFHGNTSDLTWLTDWLTDQTLTIAMQWTSLHK